MSGKRIAYVCLSDMHLGQVDSILTVFNKDTEPPKRFPERCRALDLLVSCIRDVLDKTGSVLDEKGDHRPALILAGDILELALSYTNESLMAFERFLELIFPGGEPVFKEIIYLPGNHDHHVWENVREKIYLAYLRRHRGQIGTHKPFKTPWHVTEIASNGYTSDILSQMIGRYTKPDYQFNVFYPNHILYKGDRAVIISHGHYLEGIYRMITTVADIAMPDRPKDNEVWDLEDDNFAWIDFFWSALGRSADQALGTIYDGVVLCPSSNNSVVGNIERGIVKAVKQSIRLPWYWKLLKPAILLAVRTVAWIAMKAISRREKMSNTEYISAKDAGYADVYLKYALKQVNKELPGNIIKDYTFIFGHTHKPFGPADAPGIEGLPQGFSFYNTGGWVNESTKQEKLHGGSVLFVDEDMNVSGYRMYNELEGGTSGSVTDVRLESHAQGSGNRNLCNRLAAILKDDTKGVWKNFTQEVGKNLNIKKIELGKRLAAAKRASLTSQ